MIGYRLKSVNITCEEILKYVKRIYYIGLVYVIILILNFVVGGITILKIVKDVT